MENKLIDILNIKTKEELLEITGEKDLYCFFGDPAEHSRSPQMYNKAFNDSGINGLYFASRIPDGMIREAMLKVREFGIKGVNISMPHKSKVMDELDEIDSEAELCEAVNTIVLIGEEHGLPILKGYNTDASGIAKAAEEMDPGKEIKEAVILGLGGAGKAAVVGLAKAGTKHITVFVRKMNIKGHSQYASKIANAFPGVKLRICLLSDKKELKDRLKESELLINCTNVGMGKYEGLSLIPNESYLHENLKVMDVIYSPEETHLIKQAKKAGCCYFNGLAMLYAQGEEAFKLYTGLDYKF